MTYKELVAILGNRDRKKLENNTYAERREPKAIAVRLHDTDILTFTPRAIVASTGGWNTLTTRDRLNRYLPSQFYVSTCSSILYWHELGIMSAVPFTDGDRLAPISGTDGGWQLRAQRKTATAALKLRKQIKAYAAKCAAALPLPEPGGGDCFYCQMIVSSPEADKGKPLGDATKNTDHIREHLREGYVVPSLVYHALVERGEGPIILSAAFGKLGSDMWLDLARRDVRKAVEKYVSLRLAGAVPAAWRPGFAVR